MNVERKEEEKKISKNYYCVLMCLIEETKTFFWKNNFLFFSHIHEKCIFFYIKICYYKKTLTFTKKICFFDVEHFKIHMHFNLDGIFLVCSIVHRQTK